MKKIFFLGLMLMLHFIPINTFAYTPEESCWMRTGVNGYTEINGTCVCAMPGYKDYGALDCRLDHEKCINQYGLNGEMQKTGICGCKTGTTLIENSYGKYECKNPNIECKNKFGINSNYNNFNQKCQCNIGYEFSKTPQNLLGIGLDESTLIGNNCVLKETENNITDNSNSDNTQEEEVNLNELFKDLDDEANDKYIKSAQILAEKGIIKSQENTSEYEVNNNITRREMLKIIMNLSGKNVGESCENKFKDLGNNDWGCKYAESALAFGFISNNQSFRPNENISKIEAIKMLFQANGITVTKTSDWRKGYVDKGIELGILFDGFNDYDTKAIRGFIFDISYDLLNKELDTMNDGLLNSNAFKCGDNISIEGYTYTTKLMADGKCWTTTNMKHLQDTGKSWCGNDDEKNCDMYGRLYDFEGANNICKILGNGWNLPTKENYNTLIDKGATGWTGNKLLGLVNNLSGFYDLYLNDYSGFNTHIGYWTFSKYNNEEYYVVFLNKSNSISTQYYKNIGMGYNIICIKN